MGTKGTVTVTKVGYVLHHGKHKVQMKVKLSDGSTVKGHEVIDFKKHH